MSRAGGPVAAVDCGTNSTRLLVADGAGRTLDRQMRITRLGEGVDATGALAPAAVARTLAVLEDYRRRMDGLGVVAGRLVATSAARDAANAEEFLTAAEQVSGLVPELLSGEAEGRLSFAGATAHLPAGFPGAEPVLVVDVGGGSTELVVGAPARPQEASAISVDLGCVRATERFLGHDPPTAEELAAARHHVVGVLEAARAELPPLAPELPCVGLAGTVSTLASLELSLADYERDAVHHARLGRDVVRRWLGILAAEPAPARLARPGMAAGREDVVIGGVLVLDCVMDVFGRDQCLVSEDDILDGLAASQLG
jgi:exopolyphosphatase/guanosine-5'-triphosphate,3'-diphosphate pyrophosphatase